MQAAVNATGQTREPECSCSWSIVFIHGKEHRNYSLPLFACEIEIGSIEEECWSGVEDQTSDCRHADLLPKGLCNFSFLLHFSRSSFQLEHCPICGTTCISIGHHA